MEGDVCKFKSATSVVTKPERSEEPKSNFRNFNIWMVVLMVYITVFGYIGYIAFWPMSFNDPEQTVEKYYVIVDKYANKLENDEDRSYFRNTVTELIKESESEADDMQQLASQSFNIVLGAFLAFLSATVTTIFQGNRK